MSRKNIDPLVSDKAILLPLPSQLFTAARAHSRKIREPLVSIIRRLLAEEIGRPDLAKARTREMGRPKSI